MAVIASQDFNAVGGSTANTDRFAADAVGVSLTNTAASNADPALGLVFGTQ